jgi:hypothetical protein
MLIEMNPTTARCLKLLLMTIEARAVGGKKFALLNPAVPWGQVPVCCRWPAPRLENGDIKEVPPVLRPCLRLPSPGP